MIKQNDKILKKEKMKCAECRYFLKSFVFYFCVSILLGLMFFIAPLITNDFSSKTILTCSLILAISLVCFSPLYGFYLFKCIYLKMNITKYELYNAKLGQPHTSVLLRRHVSFEVEIEVDKSTIKADSKFIFSSFAILALDIDEYVDKEIVVGYNNNTNDLIIIGVNK